ncbi:unnamed protein product [Rotaria sordida]|uniref:Uncharacterized protein n=1 Tax=Rotaria sordida TaxID=392033 RepID=A0A815KUX7_9BILA|nr:unnamed protein product [Rotaria sordida]
MSTTPTFDQIFDQYKQFIKDIPDDLFYFTTHEYFMQKKFILTDKDRKKNVQLQQVLQKQPNGGYVFYYEKNEQRLIVPMCFYNNKFICYFEGSNRNISRQFSLVYQFKDDENHQ